MKTNGHRESNDTITFPSVATNTMAAGLLAAETARRIAGRAGMPRVLRNRRANGHMPLSLSAIKNQIEEFAPVSATEREKADEFRGHKRLILSCDGGGILGIITLQCLKQLEKATGAPAFQLFDMFAGTSTGAIIAAALAAGVSVDDLITLYTDKREQIFTRTFFHRGLFRLLGRYNIFIPKYDKAPIHGMLREVFGDYTLAELPRDILVTAKDTVRGETTFFSAFHDKPYLDNMEERALHVYGTYKDVPVRAAVEASMSAPTYFKPFGRFVDGGVGSYNNTCYAAAVEALRYSEGRYAEKQVRVLSFGTGAGPEERQQGAAQKMSLLDWAQYVIGVSMEDANNQQVYVSNHELSQEEEALGFRRYQIHFNDAGMQAIGVTPPPELVHYQDVALDSIEFFDFLNEVGIAFGKYLRRHDLFDLTAPSNVVEVGKPGLSEAQKEEIRQEMAKLAGIHKRKTDLELERETVPE